ncbi:MAG: ATPase [Paracoccaceae bacterium]|nr:ATPase [Paracoccaceae bacterium]
MSGWKAKRFWKSAEVKKADGGFEILLDGRPVKTPAKAPLIVPSRAMAEAIAKEWDAQEETINPGAMPFTRTANSAIDKVTPQHAEVADLLADYGDSDLLCYRAEAPQNLVTRQAETWDPILKWCEVELGVRLTSHAGVIHRPQDEKSIARLRELVVQMSPFQLAAFHDLVSLPGSLVIGFAAVQRAFPVEDLWNASRLDELWQQEQWGRDEEADAHAEIKRKAFVHAADFYTLLDEKQSF